MLCEIGILLFVFLANFAKCSFGDPRVNYYQSCTKPTLVAEISDTKFGTKIVKKHQQW